MKKLVPILFIGVVAAFIFNSKDTFFKQSVSNTLDLSIGNPVKSFDPAIAFNDDSLSVVGQSLDTLYQYHYLKRPYEIIPSLAEGMPLITMSGTRYTIKLKKGNFYHDKTPFFQQRREVQAQDFELQIKRIAFKPIKSVGTWLFSGKIKGFDEFTKAVGNDFENFLEVKMEGVTVLDKYTLQIDLIKPEPNLLYFLCMTFTSPTPIELVKEYKNDLSKVLVGTGAYYLSSFDEDKYIFNKNKEFRSELYPSSGDRFANTQDLLQSSSEKLPFLDQVTFHVSKDENQTWEKMMNGKLDVLAVPKKFLSKVSSDAAQFEKLKKKNNFDVKYSTTISSRWLGFNMQDKVIGKNLSLRKAIAHAIDFDKYIEILSNNTNLKANSIYNPSIPGYNPSFRKSYRYDLRLAKKFLKQSNIDLSKFILTYSTRGKNQINFREAEFIKDQLSLIGIKVRVQPLSFSEFIKKGRAGEIQFFTDQWIYDYPDAENILQLLISKNSPGINKSGFKNRDVDELYEKLSFTLDKKSRYKIMEEIEMIADQELPWIMLMYESSYVIHSNYLKNFRRSFFIRNYLKYLKKKL
jgi:ABC-type transport system substrate-binding protein